VGWHDPNFGIRFDETMQAIEEVVPPGAIEFGAESSLSILTEPHLDRLRKTGFKAILPGIESWYGMGGKSKTGASVGRAKVDQVSDQVNRINAHPHVRTNFVLGLDSDEGPEPFELTKKFIDLAPGAFPAYSLLSAFGRAAPMNLDYQRAGRVLPFPFTFLNYNHAMNVRPVNYSWSSSTTVIDLRRHSFSARAVVQRGLNQGLLTRSLNVVRAARARVSAASLRHDDPRPARLPACADSSKARRARCRTSTRRGWSATSDPSGSGCPRVRSSTTRTPT
jgi:hypothetical protein